MPYKTEFAANSILQKAREDSILDVNALKLTKLLYITHGYYLAVKDKPLLPEMFEVGQYGPFLPSIFRLGRKWGADPIENWIRAVNPLTGEEGCWCVSKENDDFYGIFNRVWEMYKHQNYIHLSNISNPSASPWATAKFEGLTYIEDVEIREQFLPYVRRNTQKESESKTEASIHKL